MNANERKKTIWCIVIFSSVVTAVAFMGPKFGGSPSELGLGSILWGTAPLLTAILIRIVTRDWSDAGFKSAIRKNLRWYVISILAFPVMTVLTFLIGQLSSASSFAGFSISRYITAFLSALPVFFLFAIFEEFGWRGYLAPKLALAGVDTYRASAMVAVVWATWHLPYIRELTWVYSSEDLMSFIPRFYLALFAFAILYNEIRIITGSVWPAVLMHCLANSFGHPLAADFLTIVPGREYLVSASGLFMIAFAGLSGIALNRWRTRRATLQEGSSQSTV
jgi:membrane protease YdiL (CAAX protease family)